MPEYSGRRIISSGDIEMGLRKIQLKSLVICAFLSASLMISESVHAQVQGRVVDLTLEGMVDLGMD